MPCANDLLSELVSADYTHTCFQPHVAACCSVLSSRRLVWYSRSFTPPTPSRYRQRGRLPHLQAWKGGGVERLGAARCKTYH